MTIAWRGGSMTTLHLTELGLLGASVTGLAFSLGRVLGRERRYCPGRVPGSVLWRLLTWLVHREQCGYDLSRSIADVEGGVTCPECGRCTLVNRCRRVRDGWRPGRLSASLLLAALGLILSASVPWDRIDRSLPTDALILAQRVFGAHTPAPMRSELKDRYSQQELTDRQANNFVRLLVNDLHSDDLRFNAEFAIDQLTGMESAAIPLLKPLLKSPDWQQRQLAAHVLRRVQAPADLALLTVTVEGLKDDDFPYGSGSTDFVFNACDGVPFLVDHIDHGESLLVAGLSSADEQQQFLCAAVLGFAGRTKWAAQAAPILIEHLSDNSIEGDGEYAVVALYGFGDAAIPALEQARETPDRQQYEVVEYLLWKLAPVEQRRLDPRPSPPALTVLSLDPVEVNWRSLRAPGL